VAIASITTWLRARGPFSEGVELLKLHGRPSPADLFIYGLGETSVSRERLTHALSHIHEVTVEATGAHTHSIKATVVVSPEERAERRTTVDDKAQGVHEDQLPPELRDIRRQISADFRTLSFLRGKASNMPDGMELRQVAMEIADLHDKVRAGWLCIETWRDTGTVITFRPTQEKDREELHKERASIRSQLSPTRIAARGTPPEKVEAWRKRLNELDTLLDGPH
jgi:hypothetical protein